jgi:hypothetical protein
VLFAFLSPRVWAWRPGPHTILPLALAACSEGDLFLPDSVQLRAVSGDGQSAVAGSAVPHPLVVEARDGAGRPVEGAVIRFEFVDQPSGATIAPSAPETDSDGRASVQVTLGRPAGEQSVDARLADPEPNVSVRFLLTAIPSNTGGGGGSDDDDPSPDEGGGGGGGGGGGDGGGGDDEDGGGGKGKGKGHHGNGGGDDDHGGGNGDD